MAKLGLRTRALRVVAAGWLYAGCGDPGELSGLGASERAASAPAPAGREPARAEPAHAVSPSQARTGPEHAPAAQPSPSDAGGAGTPAPPASVTAPTPEGSGDSGAHGDGDLTCYPLLAHGGDLKTPYTLGVAADAYVAFTFAAPWKETAHAVAFQPVIDNAKVVHHWLLYQDNRAGTPGETAQALLVPGAHPDATLISAWTPGTDPLDFRQLGVDAALELPHDTTYTLEFHYNSSDAAAVDRSGVSVCTSARKPAHAAGYSWLGTENWLLPSTSWTGTCKPSASEPIHILAIVPHMHTKGRHMRAALRRADGTEEVFHDGDYDFAYERLYPLDLTLRPGDSVITTCTYSEPSTYGPSVDDEMCYLFTVAYPRGALVSADLVGGLLHGGTSCFGE